MDRKLTLAVACCLMAICATAENENGPFEAGNGVEVGGQENKSNRAQYSIECSDDTRIPEQIANCELLIAGLKSDPGINRYELCCTLMSSQATKSMCCRQVRDLCESHNASQCPKSRRRIKPPRSSPADKSSKMKKADDLSAQSATESTPTSVLLYKMKKVTVAV